MGRRCKEVTYPSSVTEPTLESNDPWAEGRCSWGRGGLGLSGDVDVPFGACGNRRLLALPAAALRRRSLDPEEEGDVYESMGE